MKFLKMVYFVIVARLDPAQSRRGVAVIKPYFLSEERLKIRLLHTYVVSGSWHMAHTVTDNYYGNHHLAIANQI